MAGGFIHSFQDIFVALPKSVIARDLGMNNVRFTRLMNNVDLFLLRDLFRLADRLEVDEMIIVNLICQQYKTDKNKKK